MFSAWNKWISVSPTYIHLTIWRGPGPSCWLLVVLFGHARKDNWGWGKGIRGVLYVLTSSLTPMPTTTWRACKQTRAVPTPPLPLPPPSSPHSFPISWMNGYMSPSYLFIGQDNLEWNLLRTQEAPSQSNLWMHDGGAEGKSWWTDKRRYWLKE